MITMTNKVSIEVDKENYNKVMKIVDHYTKGKISVMSKKDCNEIEFECSIFKVNALKRDVRLLADKLGLQLKIEIE